VPLEFQSLIWFFADRRDPDVLKHHSCVFHGANGRPMASHHEHSQQRVPPPHDPLPNAAAVRPKPLWQPWSDSDGDYFLKPFFSSSQLVL
jgi:hypothetical protein